MLTELKTMTVKEHWAISSINPYKLAGNNCCRWHLKMPPEYANRGPVNSFQTAYQAGYRAGLKACK